LESDALVLGFDTSAAHCAAALLSGDTVLVSRAEEMGRGQAERLMPLLEDLLAEAGAAWRDLDRLGVGIGPGNFTGIRISVAAARGLSMALEIPAVGVSGFDVIAHAHVPGHVPALPAPRDQLYVRAPGCLPKLARRDEAEALGLPLVGPPPAADMAEAIARLAAAHAAADIPPPAPLYLRPADAAPARDAPPVILDDA
jgi:tRNA threonylcarbamoyl adenosine modification protein YeaZ